MDPVLFWNSVLLEVSRRDFTRGLPGGQQPGPIRTSRAMAIVHLAIHDAVAFHAGQPNRSYLVRKGQPAQPAPPAAATLADVIAGAAATAIKGLYGKSHAFVDDLTPPADPAAFSYGADIADALLALRDGDGWKKPIHEPQNPAPTGTQHRADPYQPGQQRLGVHWGAVTRFTTVHPAGHHERLDPVPLSDYPQDLAEVRDYGAVGRGKRTAEQERIGVYWGYDGANGLGVPPRLYNQVVRAVVAGRSLTTPQLADIFARVNVAMADAGIDAWHWKYVYDFWRPVVGVRAEAAPAGDPFWGPYGIPRTNNSRASFSPDFPAYPSGHATFGAAMFQVLAKALGGSFMTLQDVLDVDDARAKGKAAKKVKGQAFTFVSDELDGVALDPDSSPRTRVAQPFVSFAEGVWENSISRVYLGVHWRFDGMPRKNVAGQRIGGVPLGLAIGEEANLFFTNGPGAISNLP